MIAIPLNNAPERTSLLASHGRAHASVLARVVLTLAFMLGLPGLAHASAGGVSVGASSTTAKGAQAEVEPAPAAEKPRSVSKNQVRRAQTLLRVTATGSNDVKTRKVVKRFQGLRGITTHGVIDLPTYLQIKDAFALLETGGAGVEVAADPDATGGVTTAEPAVPEVILPPNLAPITPTEQAILDTISQCESKGDPAAISTNGLYRGKYQFDRATWKSVGGAGDPAAATEVEQDQRAAILLRQRGTAPWPICGRNAA